MRGTIIVGRGSTERVQIAKAMDQATSSCSLDSNNSLPPLSKRQNKSLNMMSSNPGLSGRALVVYTVEIVGLNPIQCSSKGCLCFAYVPWKLHSLPSNTINEQLPNAIMKN